jgi:hypothetical protein
MKIWAKTEEFSEGKFLVVRRDGSVPHWPHFVLGARDPHAPAALRAYVEAAESDPQIDSEYLQSILDLADDFEDYRKREGNGDPNAPPHRTDDPNVITAMRHKFSVISVVPDKRNVPK